METIGQWPLRTASRAGTGTGTGTGRRRAEVPGRRPRRSRLPRVRRPRRRGDPGSGRGGCAQGAPPESAMRADSALPLGGRPVSGGGRRARQGPGGDPGGRASPPAPAGGTGRGGRGGSPFPAGREASGPSQRVALTTPPSPVARPAGGNARRSRRPGFARGACESWASLQFLEQTDDLGNPGWAVTAPHARWRLPRGRPATTRRPSPAGVSREAGPSPPNALPQGEGAAG